MTMTDKIMTIIMSEDVTKDIFNDKDGCFGNIAVNTLMECNNDNVLETSIHMLAMQCKLYDTLINNIAKYGSKELIEKCNNDINSVLSE